MSDFLTNLAARTLTQPALQPRVLSRFEPERRGEPVLPAEETEPVRVSPPPQLRHALPPVTPEPAVAEEPPSSMRVSGPELRQARAPLAPPELPERKTKPAARVEEVAPPPALPSRRAPMPGAMAPPKQETRTSATSPRTATRREVPSRPHEKRGKDATPPIAARIEVREKTNTIEVPILQREPALVPPQRETIVETRTETREVRVPVERPVIRHETRSRYEEVPPVITDVREETPPRLMGEERLTTSTITRRTREARAVRAIEEAPASPPQPEIHVSIGRVEVRATTAPASDRRHREQPRVMTIDDYVARRGRKERP
jgi:hypothetical protein